MSFTSLAKFVIAAAALSTLSPSYAVPVEVGTSILHLERSLEAYELLSVRADGAACHPISSEEFQKLPTWSKITKYVEETYGSLDARFIANPTEYPDSVLQACLKDSFIPVQFAEKPQCSTSERTLSGSSVGSGTGVKYTTKRGFSQSTSWSVTGTSSLSIGTKFTVSVGFPEVADVSSETSISTTITNERSSSFKTDNNQEESLELTVDNKDGEMCKVNQKSTVCTATAKGRAPVVAQGQFWFFFHDSREMKDHPEYGSHFHWNVNIADVLSEEERTSYMTFEGPTSINSNDAYKTNCGKIEG